MAGFMTNSNCVKSYALVHR